MQSCARNGMSQTGDYSHYFHLKFIGHTQLKWTQNSRLQLEAERGTSWILIRNTEDPHRQRPENLTQETEERRRDGDWFIIDILEVPRRLPDNSYKNAQRNIQETNNNKA